MKTKILISALAVLGLLSFAGRAGGQNIEFVYTCIDTALEKPAAIEHLSLDLAQQEFNPFVRKMHQFSNLKTLKLKNDFPGFDWSGAFSALSSLPRLERLELENNAFSSPPLHSFLTQRISTLVLCGNRQLNWEDTFFEIAQIGVQQLILDDCRLKNIPEEMSLLSSLRSLEIRNNYELNTAKLFTLLSGLNSFTSLSLISDGLEALPPDIGKLSRLRTLRLKDNFLVRLPLECNGLSSLSYLEVDGNRIRNASLALAGLKGMNPDSVQLDENAAKNQKELLAKTFPQTKLKFVKKEVQKLETVEIKAAKTLAGKIKTSPVKPLAPQLDTRFKTYSVNGSTDMKIIHRGSSSIYIPAQSFVDEQGNVVQGEVRVNYREFNNPLDIVMSGVPMTYAEGDEKGFFQTAGMFEITANTPQGQQLRLREGRNIQVYFPTRDSVRGYNFYYLNPATGQWEVKDTLKTKDATDLRKYGILSPAYLYFRPFFNSFYDFDSTGFEERYTDFTYTRTKKDPRKVRGAEYGFMIKREKGSYMKKPLFSIEVNTQTYPELSRVEDLIWVYNGPLARKDFNKAYCKKKKWRDMRINYYPDDFYFTFELKGKENLTELTGFPKLNTPRDMEARTIRLLSKIYSHYSRTLSKTGVRFEHNLKRNQDRAIAKFRKEYIREWEKVKPMMSDSEKMMTCDEWVKYYLNLQDSLTLYSDDIRRAELAVLNASTVNSGNLMQSFQLDGLGIWNCDRLLRNEDYVPVVAEYTDKEDNPIPAATTYVLDLEANGVLTFGSSNISIHKSNRTVLIVQGRKNELYYITDQEISRAFNETESKRKRFVAMEVASGTSVEDFRKKTGIFTQQY